MTSYLLRGLVALGKLFMRFRRFIPRGLLGIFIITQFFITLFTDGLSIAFQQLAKSLLAAELVINEAVKLAIQDSPLYNLEQFFAIITSLLVIYIFVKFIGKILQNWVGAQAPAMTYVVGFLIFAIVEISAVKVIDGSFGFIPLKDGVIFLLFNLQPVLSNIHFW